MTGIAIPETAEELEELLNDNDRVGEIMAAGQLADFNRQYMAKALGKARAELVPQFREQAQLGWQQFLQDQSAQGYGPQGGFRPGGTALGKRDARRSKAISRARLHNAADLAEQQLVFSDTALGADFDEEPYAQSVRAFMFEMWKAEKVARDHGDNDRSARVQDYKQKLFNALARPQNASLSERLPAEGGFLVPEVLRSEILMVALETAVVRPRARVIPMDSLRVPLPIIDDTSHASNVYGGVAAYWTAEGATLSATAPSFGRFELEARKLTAYTTIPNELLQDSITSLDTWFNIFFPRAMAWFEDVAFISGTGVGEPQGFLNAPAAVTISTSSAHEIKFSHIASAYSRMWPASLNNAVWLCSPDVLLSLLQMAMNDLSSGTAVAPPLWLQSMSATGHPGGGGGDGVNYLLMGRPLIVSEKMPSSTSGNTTTAGALAFVDLGQYLLGDRQAMQIATSEEYLFASDLVAYRVIERLDGRIWQQSAITPQNGSTNTLSPVVLVNTAG